MSAELKKKLGLWGGKLSKFKFPAIILLVGVILVLIPFGKSDTVRTEQPAEQETDCQMQSEDAYCLRMQNELADILSRVDGAGRVQVLLSLKTGRQTQYQSDYTTSNQQKDTEQAASTEQKTVLLSRGNAYIEAAVVRTEYPAFQGALVVSEGADNAAVRLSLVSAVSVLLGLGTDKITVVKMK